MTPSKEKDEPMADEFLVARVSQDGHEVGIDHPTEAPWEDVLRAHVSLRDRLNERLAEKDLCPFAPKSNAKDDAVEAVDDWLVAETVEQLDRAEKRGQGSRLTPEQVRLARVAIETMRAAHQVAE